MNSLEAAEITFLVATGKSADFNDITNVDWVPSINLGYEKNLDRSEEEAPDCGLCEDCNEKFNTNVSHSNDKEVQTDPILTGSLGTQTDDKITVMSTEIIISYEERIQLLEEMLCRSVSVDSFRGDNKKTNFFTGISNFATLEELFNLCEPLLPYSRKLTKFQIMFIVLNRFRLNLSFKYFSYQFDVSIPTISKHFHSALTVMYKKLRYFVYWPERECIRKTMPLAFQEQFNDTIVLIIDCFEVFIERPANLKAAVKCWSCYKHATTIKYLVGITPQGFIAFISTGFGGRSSDKFVTENSGFLDKVCSGDVVMADRGFLIEEELKQRNVELQMPTFTKGKTQLHPIDIEETRKIANVRIHVERIIGQLRLKFKILHQFKFPISLIKKKTVESVSTIDKIVTVCCALSNLCNPIVCKEEENK